MSYALPLAPVPVAGEGIPYTWFLDLQSSVEALRLGTQAFNYPKSQVYNNAAQSIGTGAFTTLTFNAEDNDALGLHSTSVNTSRFTIPAGQDGNFLFVATTAWAANATGVRQIQIIKNGGATPIGTRGIAAGFSVSSLGPTVTAHAQVLLAATDFVEVQVFQDSGGNLNAGNAARELASQVIVTRVI